MFVSQSESWRGWSMNGTLPCMVFYWTYFFSIALRSPSIFSCCFLSSTCRLTLLSISPCLLNATHRYNPESVFVVPLISSFASPSFWWIKIRPPWLSCLHFPFVHLTFGTGSPPTFAMNIAVVSKEQWKQINKNLIFQNQFFWNEISSKMYKTDEDVIFMKYLLSTTLILWGSDMKKSFPSTAAFLAAGTAAGLSKTTRLYVF